MSGAVSSVGSMFGGIFGSAPSAAPAPIAAAAPLAAERDASGDIARKDLLRARATAGGITPLGGSTLGSPKKRAASNELLG